MRVDSRKFLSVGVLLLISTLAVNGATSKDAAIVKDVSFSNTGESLEAKITASEDSKYTYFELKAPHRLVVDFHGIQNTISFKEKKIDAAGVERVRTSLFSDKKRQVTRIVFDLVTHAQYRVIEDGGGIVRIVFGEAVRAPMNLTAGPVMIPEPGKYSISSSGSPAIELASVLQPIQPALAAPQAPAAAPAAIPPAPPVPAPVALVASVPAAASRLSPVMAAAESSMLQQTQVTVVPATPPQVPATTPTATPQYTGEIITIDIVNYDIKDFFRLISEISGLNVVLDPQVSGNVTLKLTDVPWDQALDVVLKNYGLGGQLQGNILRIATNATLAAEQTAQKNLRDAQDLATPLATKTFSLSYMKVAEVQPILSKLLTPRGNILPVTGKNALIIQDLPSQFTNLESMLKFLDTPARQVEIEARLLQANKSFSQSLGSQISFLLGNKSGNVLTGLPGTTSAFPTPTGPNATGAGVAALPLVANFPAAATTGLSFLLKPGGDILLDAIIGAAEVNGTAKLISRPKVMTQNNVAATIQQGTQIPVQTNVNNTISVQFASFTLNLSVTPQITEAGTILLQVNIQNSQPDFAKAVNGIPSVSTQSATTTVLVPDGGTAVIGGIIVDTDTINVQQIPGLGSLPVIGNLFKSTSTAKTTSELFFFITPRIKALDAISVLAPGEEAPAAARPQQR